MTVTAYILNVVRKRGQLGFTLAEIMVALAVGALMMAGSVAVAHYVVVDSQESKAETTALLEVQYVGFWIGEDSLQAQTILLGNSTGFPLILRWIEWDGDANEVTYSVSGEEAWTLQREQKINGESYGIIDIGKHLEPGNTYCERAASGTGELDILKLAVRASVDGNEIDRTYQFQPRSKPLFWGSSGL